MNKLFLSWLDFAAKCFIVTFAVYLMLNNFFLTDIRYLVERVNAIDAMTRVIYQKVNP